MSIKEKITKTINLTNRTKAVLNKNLNKIVDLQELNELIETGSKISELILAFSKAENTIGKIKASLDIVNYFTNNKDEKIVDEYNNEIDAYINKNNWIWLFDAKLATIVFHNADSKPVLKYCTPEEKKFEKSLGNNDITSTKDVYGFYTFFIGKYELGYIGRKDQVNVYTLYVQEEQSNIIKTNIINIISAKIWNKFDSKNLKIIRIIEKNYQYYDLVVDEDTSFFPSAVGNEIATEIEIFNKANIHRTILLLGPPGTGKSTAIKYITHKLNFSSLRISNEVVDNDILQLIEIIKPNILIIDDFDRILKQSVLLDFMTDMKKSSKAFLISCNFFNQLDPAIKRPGRIDNIYYIEKLDKEVIKNILGIFAEQTPEAIYSWPIAYIQEYANRCKYLGPEQALKSLLELQSRIDNMDEVYKNKKEFKLKPDLAQ